MLKEKRELELYLEKQILKIVSETDLCNKIYDYAMEKYNIPKAIASDYITLRNPLSEANEFILFCLLDSIEQVNEKKKSVIPDYYVEKEIKTYSTSQYKVSKIKFPIRFKAIQIAEDQWISSIDFKTLMKLRAAQLILYNENTQRTMKRVVHGEKEIYVIDIDKPSVSAIEELYKNRTYIPTPLTFNIPMDSDADFYYDEENCELVIRTMDGFDIIDGYHRYLAACKACDSDKDIDFTMELRIINFPEDKAQQFIYQEDQKTIMKKVNSNTFDQTSVSNRVVERLNTNPQSNLQGLISRNKTLIKYSDLSELIKYFYINSYSAKKANNNSLVISISNELIENFNMLTEYNKKYIEKKYSYQKIFIVMYCFSYYINKDKSDMCSVIDKVLEKANSIDERKFYRSTSKKILANELEEILKEVL